MRRAALSVMRPSLLALTFGLASAAPKLPLQALRPPSAGRLLGLDLDILFDKADINKDGEICFWEFYDVTVTTYIMVNRKGIHLSPPPRAKLEALFKRADTNNDGKLSRSEFGALAPVLTGRLGVRVATFVFFRFLVSPYLAWMVVKELTGHPWLAVARGFVPARLSTLTGPVIFTDDFWRAVLLIGFAGGLGYISMSALNAFLDSNPFERKPV